MNNEGRFKTTNRGGKKKGAFSFYKEDAHSCIRFNLPSICFYDPVLNVYKQETNPVSHFSHTKGKHLIHEEGRHWLQCQALLRACGMDPAYSRRGKKSSLMRGATLLGSPPFNNTHNTIPHLRLRKKNPV